MIPTIDTNERLIPIIRKHKLMRQARPLNDVMDAWEWSIPHTPALLTDLNCAGWPYHTNKEQVYICCFFLPTATVLELTQAELVGTEPQNVDTSEATGVRDGQKYAYSTNEEFYHGEFSTPEQAAAEAFAEDPDLISYHVGLCVKPKPEDYIDSQDILHRITEQAEDQFGGEWAESWCEMICALPREKYEELNDALGKVMAEWLGRHGLRPTFYNIEKSKRVKNPAFSVFAEGKEEA
jgi:hypothetical protein